MKRTIAALFLVLISLTLPGVCQPMVASLDSSDQIADRIIKSKVPLLVDFWAPWCGPCRMLNPIIKELEKEYSGKIAVVKVNIDKNRRLATYFRVSSIPAVFIIKDSTVVNSLLGVQPKESYQAAIEAAIAQKKAVKDTVPASL
jgi:thioredoxin 1